MDVDFGALDFDDDTDYEKAVKAIQYFESILTLPGIKPMDFMSIEEYMFARSTYEMLTIKLFMFWAKEIKNNNFEIYQLYKKENLSDLEIGKIVVCTLLPILDKENK